MVAILALHHKRS